MALGKAVTYMVVNEATRQQVFRELDNIGNYEVIIKPITEKKVRTNKQNASIHLYCNILAEAYREYGLDMGTVLAKQASVPWDMENIKDKQWKLIQEAMGFDKSTTKLAPEDVTKVYAVLNKHTFNQFGIDLEFPSEQAMMRKAVYKV